MTITQIEQTKRGRYSIFSDGEFLFSVDEDTLVSYGLFKGKEITGEFVQELQSTVLLQKAKDRAFNLVSYRERSSQELVDRLKETAEEETAVKAVGRLQELGYVDDSRFAKMYARDLFFRKGLGPKRIRYELKLKGISQELIEEAVDFTEEQLVDRLDALIEKKYLRVLSKENGRRKVTQSLSQLGYGFDEIRTALSMADVEEID